VAPITIVIGILLIALGPIGWFGADEDKQSWTAFIPTIFGVILLVLGVLALQDRLRKHAMHAAAAVGLLGFLASGSRIVPAVFGEIRNLWAFEMQTAMGLLCLVFVLLCVKSFIDARRRRQIGNQ
jgi:hypothetical protein